MIDQANHISSSSLLLPLREKGEDFGMVPAFSKGCFDQADGIGIDRKTAAVEPILDIGGSTNPFKVICPAIGFDFILMMNKGKFERIRHKGLSHKSMYRNSPDFPLFGKFDLGIPVTIRTINSDCWSGISTFGPAINIPSDTFNPSDIADLVQTFVSGNRSPFLARFADIFNYRLNIREQIFRRGLNVKFFGFIPFSRFAQIRNQIPVVARQTKKSRLQRSGEITADAMIGISSKASNSVSIGDFILSFVTRNGKPILDLIIHFLSPSFLFCTSNKGKYRQSIAVGQANKLISKIKE